MNRYFALLFTILIVLGAHPSNAQGYDSTMLLRPADISSGYISDTRFFTDSSLYGYMNGGADLFLEYGVKQLIVQDVIITNRIYRAEVYQFPDSASAFGIYSILSPRCKLRDMLTPHDCYNSKQFQLVMGNYYLSIYMLKEDTATRRNLIVIAKMFKSKKSKGNYTIPSLFQTEPLKPYLDNFKLMLGPLGVQNGFPDWMELFEAVGNYKVEMLPIEIDTSRLVVSKIVFQSPSELELFKRKNGLFNRENPSYSKRRTSDRKTLLMAGIDDKSALLLELTGSQPFLNKLLQQIENVSLEKNK